MRLPTEKRIRLPQRTSPLFEQHISGLQLHLDMAQGHLDCLRENFGIDRRTAGLILQRRADGKA